MNRSDTAFSHGKRDDGSTRHRNINDKGIQFAQLFRLGVIASTSLGEDGRDIASLGWKDIVCVDYLGDAAPTCPICMDHSMVPQMLECGHIFCLSCILIHFSSASSCCVCNKFAKSKDLRSVRTQLVSSACTGTSRTFQLVSNDSDLVQPVGAVSQGIPDQNCPGWWFSSLYTMSIHDLRGLHMGERRIVLENTKHSDDTEGMHAMGIIYAMDFLHERIDSLGQVRNPFKTANEPEPEYFGYVDIDIGSLQSIHRHAFTPGSIYTFRLVDGQHVYLEPVWMRALLLHYTGSAEGWDRVDLVPSSLSLPIIYTTQLTVDRELRKRYKQISHLPLGSAILLCDVDVRGIVPPDVLESMSSAVQRRLEVIKREKAQKRVDKRDVRRANAVPLIHEWALQEPSLRIQPEVVPKYDDFIPLCDPVTVPASTLTYAKVASELSSSEGAFTAPLVRTPVMDPLLSKYTRNQASSRNEVGHAIDELANGSGQTGGKSKKKGFVKVRIAG